MTSAKRLMERKMTYIGFGIDEVKEGVEDPKFDGYFLVRDDSLVIRKIRLDSLDGEIALRRLKEGVELACDMYNFCKNSPELFNQKKP